MTSFNTALVAGWMLLIAVAASARGAVTLQDFHVTNVGTTTFTAVWTTSEVSTPALDVFADSEGTQSLTDTVALEFYPVAEGDPSVINDAEAREARRSLQELAINRRVVVVRASGLQPGTTYFVRPRSLDRSGAHNGAAVFPLQPARTANATDLVPDGGLLRVRFPALAAEGMVALVQGPAGTLPLSMIVGDSTDADSALIPLANLIDAATGTNPVLNGPQPITVRLLGADAPAESFTQEIDFSGSFQVAQARVVEADLSSPAPFFTQHPEDAAGIAGGSVTFEVAASGTPEPSFRWQRKAVGSETWVDLSDTGNISGSGTSMLTISLLTLDMSGDAFRARAFNGVPPDALSDPAVLTVALQPVAPLILSHPESVAVVQGAPASFTVAASGIPAPTYQWQRKPAGAVEWTDLADDAVYGGTQSATLSIQATSPAMHGDNFRAIASNGVEPNAVTQAATLSVAAASVAPTIISQPQSQEAVVGDTATFAVEATGVPTPSYQWQHKPAGSDLWTDLVESATYADVAGSVLSVNNVTAAMSGDAFRAVASNGTEPNAISAPASLTVLTPPVIEQQPESLAVAAGAHAQFAVVASGSGELTYQWQRRADGEDVWQDLANGGLFAGATSPSLTISAAPVSMSGDQFRVLVNNDYGTTTSEPAVLSVTQSEVVIVIENLRQRYDGAAKLVAVATTPAGLDVEVTYNGLETEPIYPGVYAVEVQVTEAGYTGSATAELIIGTDVVVRRAPTLLGGVNGSLQVVEPESITVDGWISGDLLVVGTPNIIGESLPTYGGTIDASGAVQPTNHAVTLGSSAALRHVVRRVDAPAWPLVPTIPKPSGTRNVSLTKPDQSAGDFATIRNLTLGGNAGAVALPPGTYGNVAVDGSATLVLGVAGATDPAVYNFQLLSVNLLRGRAKVDVVGPVILNIEGNVSNAYEVGNADNPDWLRLNIATGALNLLPNSALHGHVFVSSGLTTIQDRAILRGSLVSDRLTMRPLGEAGFPEPEL